VLAAIVCATFGHTVKDGLHHPSPQMHAARWVMQTILKHTGRDRNVWGVMA